MSDTTSDSNLPEMPPLAPPNPPPAPPAPEHETNAGVPGGAADSGDKPPLPTTLSNAQNLIDAALAGRKLSVKENPTLQMKWEQMYGRLLSYRERHGNCLVPNRYKEDRSLGQWVSAQRRQYKQLMNGEDSPMNKERAALLESVGFVWATLERGHVPWEVRYQELMAYKQKFGDCLVPIGYKANPQLSSWVSTQRQEMKLLKEGRPTRLTEDRIRLLNDGGFVWESQRGKRGGRKKKRKSEGAGVGNGDGNGDGNDAQPSSPSSLSNARPSNLAARLVTDSDASLPPLYPSSGGETAAAAAAAITSDRIVSSSGQFSDADCDVHGAIAKKRKTTSDSCPVAVVHPVVAPTPYQVRSAPHRVHSAPLPSVCGLGGGGIFDDADEDEDVHTAVAVDTYFKAKQRGGVRRPTTAANFSRVSSDSGASLLLRRAGGDVPLPPPPRLAHRKVTSCGDDRAAAAEPGAGAGDAAPRGSRGSQEQSQQEAAVALLSVGRAI